ncbi:HTH-type transcriptional regulator KdgR [Agrilactobacillus composti DSM 18527 = JCM 14202]|uniref:HTH-type transcriptional regulator KdgR n=1 Tax=Agrilactobacillus composti DSM 18527 = JCM 14202 TaxID=1423734 RepID=A0A0R1Y1P6_9LACO|nr:LacI family DNA-binding transcriptional regulator [Agrilactobacillus composti]KRM36272.1 HTH-type transcriptional regulator KdgR [Agrilactobacillus composti DSM 18527 = JCM 14202]
MAKVTISDVAQAAGVSKATVSRYLNKHFERMSPNTRQKIAKVIEDLNYQPSFQASALKSNWTHLVGVVVADISNIYSTLLITGINEVAKAHGNQIMIGDASDDLNQQQESIELLLRQNVDGLIIQPMSQDPHDYAYLRQSGTPTVMVDRLTKPLFWPTVTSDDYASTYKLAQAVLAAGYQDILIFINKISVASTRQMRAQAFLDATQDKARVTLLETANDDPKVVADWLVQHPNAHPVVFAGNGRLLMALLLWIKDQGLTCPEDLGVCGYDDWRWAALVGPGISCVTQYPIQIGQQATELLAQIIGGKRLPATQVKVAADLNLRGSF